MRFGRDGTSPSPTVAFRVVWVAAGALLAPGCGDAGEGEPWFQEEAAPRGIDFAHVSGYRDRFLLPEIVGSGAALADLDGDGDLDAYLVQSGSLYEDSPPFADRLYWNDGCGNFQVSRSPLPTRRGYGMGVATGDYDNDGDVDLYVTTVGPNALLRNDGGGHFAEVAQSAGVDDAGFGASAAFLDLDLDGDLDLFLANYIHWSGAAELDCYIAGNLTYCPPQNYNAPAPDRLFRNNGDGTFTDVSGEAGLNLAFGNGFGVIGADYNGDGLTDVYVANDMMVNQLWINRGELRFADSAMAMGAAVDGYGTAKAGMGVAAADLDDDSDVDLLVVNLEGQTDSLYLNQGEWFDDATAEFGLAVSSRRHTRFGVALADFDNDGTLDLYEANGRVSSTEDRQGDMFAEPNMLYRGTADGKFEEVSPYGGVRPSLVHTSRGLALGDVDDDGGLDLLIVNRDAPPYLLMNRVSGRGNWVRFRVVDQGRDSHAAVVSGIVGGVRKYREVQPASSYLSANSPRVHFGLGSATAIEEVMVHWPDGDVEARGTFDAGRTVELRRGES
ncbi:MAG: CRTAC1 family protein [Pseudomonadales bacterium]|nr:CRTAC1 family protein [Pseudomonadales bacterium]